MLQKIISRMVKLILLLVLLQIPIAGTAQTDPVEGVVKLNVALQNRIMDIDVSYYYEEDDSAGVVRDTLECLIMCSSNRVRMGLGGMIKINNDYYFTLIDTVNHEIYVSNPQNLANQYATTQLTNPDFVKAYIDSMKARDSSTCSIITIYFKESSPYNTYEVIYKTSSLEPVSLKYSMKKEADTTNWVGSSLPEIRLKIVFNSFTVPAHDYTAATFSTDEYFIRKNGVLVLQPAYAGYQLIDMTTGN